MGRVHVDADLAWEREETIRVLVDTGATYALVPEDLADRLGLVKSPRSVRVTLADGRERDLPFGTVLVRLEGREAAATVLIAPAGAEPLIGVEALEALGLSVDPTTGRLKPTRSHAVLLVGVRPHATA
jgi:clan AA aspartic protease